MKTLWEHLCYRWNFLLLRIEVWRLQRVIRRVRKCTFSR
jgi:hypothetical protein